MSKYFYMAICVMLVQSSYGASQTCPELKIQDLQKLHLDREISVQGQKWYLKSTYKENQTVLGTFLPLAITSQNIERSTKISLDQQLTDRECQYRLEMPSMKATGFLLFSRVGN